MPLILVVDDEEMVRRALRQLLERHGHNVIEAQDGEEGLRLFRSQRADIVICDLIMPRADGISTIANIRRLEPEAKIIAISGGGRSHAIELLDVAGQMGADQILSKPFTKDQLLGMIARCLPADTLGTAAPSTR